MQDGSTYKYTILVNSFSPHQLPFVEELANLVGKEKTCYIYTKPLSRMRQNMGWQENAVDLPHFQRNEICEETLNSEMLICGVRNIDLFVKRAESKHNTYYMSERWLKPPIGILRLLDPKYLFMCMHFIKILNENYLMYLAIGIHAAIDIIRIYLILQGKIQYIFNKPILTFESKPGGIIVPLEDVLTFLTEKQISDAKKYGFAKIPQEHWGKVKPKGIYDKIRLWGYFVKSSSLDNGKIKRKENSILWVGRMDKWKKLPVLVRSCVELNLPLDVYGHGDDEENSKILACNKKNIHFHDYVGIEQVRELMRLHDILVLSSNGGEGWGAVVNEALTEKMKVIGTYEAGASATMLDDDCLYEADKHEQLKKILSKDIRRSDIGLWNPRYAAKYILDN